MRDYQVINPIKLNGKVVRDGTVALGDTDGALLIAQGFVAPTPDTVPTVSSDTNHAAAESEPAAGTSTATDPSLTAATETGAVVDVAPAKTTRRATKAAKAG